MIQTTTFDQPKSSITSHAGSASQLSSTCQHLLPKRIARRPKPSLRGYGIALRETVPEIMDMDPGMRYLALRAQGRCPEAACRIIH